MSRPYPGQRRADTVRRLLHWRRVFWLGVALGALGVTAVLLTRYGPASRMAAIETGASFSVSAGSFASAGKAATFAAALDASGLPILVRMRPEDGRHQVLVGPFISTDEAERAQRRLATWGLGEARFVVDDTMRARPQEAAIFGFGESDADNVVMLAAPRMVSIVFEMHGVPKEVEVRRTGKTLLDVEIGRTAATSAYKPLSLPDGVSLVRDFFVRRDDDGAMSAHLVVPEGIEHRLRLEGRRIYLDLAFTTAPWNIRRAVAAAKSETPSRVVVARPSPDYQEQVNAVAERFTQIAPFLLSAAEAPEPDVLAALAHSIDDVRESLTKIVTPPEFETTRQAMLDALTRASAALAPGFESDRAAAVRDAVTLFDASTQ